MIWKEKKRKEKTTRTERKKYFNCRKIEREN